MSFINGSRYNFCLLSNILLSISNVCSHKVDSNSSATEDGQIALTSVQQIKVTLKKKVKFRVEGEIPQRKSLQEFSVPQLPRPGEEFQRSNPLKIKKYVNFCFTCLPFFSLLLISFAFFRFLLALHFFHLFLQTPL